MLYFKKLLQRILGSSIVLVIIVLIIYIAGIPFKVFPPVKALWYQLEINKTANSNGEQSLQYAIALDNLADIYHKKDHKKRESKTRIRALDSFIDNSLEETLDYADCLYKYSNNLKIKEKDIERKYALDSRDCYLKLYHRGLLNDNSKRNFISQVLATTTYVENNEEEEILFCKTAIEVHNSIEKFIEKDVGNKILLNTALGMLYTDNYTNWLEAQNCLEIAMKMSENKEYIYQNTIARISFARLLIRIKNYEKAEAVLSQSNPKVIKKDTFRITHKKLMSEALMGMGDIEEAIKELKKIETLNYKNDHNIQFITLINNANNHIIKGNKYRAKYYLNKLNNSIKKHFPNDDMRLFSYYTLQLNYNIQFDQSKLVSSLNKAKSIGKKDWPSYIHLLRSEASIAKLTDKDEFLNINSEIFDLANRKIRNEFKYLTEYQRTQLWKTFENDIERLYEAGYYSKNNPRSGEVCYNAALFSKGILLSSSIEFTKLLVESEDKDIVQDYYQMIGLREQINSDQTDQLSKDSLSLNANRIERRLIQKSKILGDYTQKLLYKWEDVHSSLKSSEVSIEFIDFNTEKDTIYAALVLKKEWDAPRVIPLFEKQQLLKLINKTPSKIYSKKNGGELYKLIWEPLEPFINKDNNVYFSASGLLYKIAIESLPRNDGSLISERNNIIRLSSTREICIENADENIKSCVLYGGLNYDLDKADLVKESKAYTNSKTAKRSAPQFRSGMDFTWEYLPKTKIEVQEIDSLFYSKNIPTQTYIGSKGNEESFKALSKSDISVIHIATHGFFLKTERAKQMAYYEKEYVNPTIDNSMQRSGLLFSGANNAWLGKDMPENLEDGVLTAQEVATLDFRKTDLVVLSACETGLGEITSEGVFGLQRSFKRAGVNTLVMSLWKVEDRATKLFMFLFYDNLLKGNSKLDAFKMAQKELRLNNEFSDPSYWAAFIMVD